MSRNHRLTLISAFPVLFAALVGCDGGPDHYEDVTKLRGIGIASSPVIAAPGESVTMTFYAALPLGSTVTGVSNYTDVEGTVPVVSASLTPDTTKAKYDDHATLRLYSVSAQLTVPDASQLQFTAAAGFATVHFGLQLNSAVGTQSMVGNLVVYPSGASQLADLNHLPNIAITAPTKNGVTANAKQAITANVTSVNGEPFRVGWFVSGGVIDNRNAATTKWDPKGSGAFTVIVTTRGADTAAFAMDVSDVTVQ